MSKKQNRRSNVKSSILILLLIAILLIASTYAWFTANTTVGVTNLEVNVQASNGLQISADATNWKAILSKDDILPTETLAAAYPNNTNQIPEEMEPVSTIGEIDASNGFMKMYYGEVLANETTGNLELTSTVQSDTRGTNGYYVAFDVFLRADADTGLILTADSGVSSENATKRLEYASRVAFIVEGHAERSATAATVQRLHDLAVSFGEANSTTYIWEPNYDVHTQEGILNAKSTYGLDTTTGPGAREVPYYGVKSIITTPIDLANTGGTKGVIDPDYFTPVDPTYKTPETIQDIEIFDINQGITKLRIYMWVEGQDVDCENSASGTNITFNLSFEAADL